MSRTTDEILMRRYLLGDLPQEERASLEDRYFADDNVFEDILATENDLVDCYVRGELTEVERQKFEQEFFKSPQRRNRVAFARALSRVSDLAKQPATVRGISSWQKFLASFSVQRLVPQWTLAIAAVVVVACGSWLTVQQQRLRVDLRRALATQAGLQRGEDTLRQHIVELESNSRDQVQQNDQRPEVAKLEPPIALTPTITLTAGITRGSQSAQKTLLLPPVASAIRMRLIWDRDEYASYNAILQTAEGDNVVNRKGLKSQRVDNHVAIVLAVPSYLLRSADYILTLTGTGARGVGEETEAYAFRVVRK